MADLSQRRFCARCNQVTVWDSPGDARLQCTNWPDGDESHCGFTLAAVLTDEECANAAAYEKRLNPAPRRVAYQLV